MYAMVWCMVWYMIHDVWYGMVSCMVWYMVHGVVYMVWYGIIYGT